MAENTTKNKQIIGFAPDMLSAGYWLASRRRFSELPHGSAEITTRHWRALIITQNPARGGPPRFQQVAG